MKVTPIPWTTLDDEHQKVRLNPKDLKLHITKCSFSFTWLPHANK